MLILEKVDLPIISTCHDIVSSECSQAGIEWPLEPLSLFLWHCESLQQVEKVVDQKVTLLSACSKMVFFSPQMVSEVQLIHWLRKVLIIEFRGRKGILVYEKLLKKAVSTDQYHRTIHGMERDFV